MLLIMQKKYKKHNNYSTIMKKLFYLIFAAVLAAGFASCGQSEEEKALTRAVYSEYKDRQMRSDTIKDKSKSGDTIKYEVEFDIQEMYPSRRNYYEGSSDIFRIGNGSFNVKSLHYRENRRLNR